MIARCLLLSLCSLLPTKLLAQDISVSHGLSAFGELAYAADFPHFSYVNPEAPKGGSITTISTAASKTYDSLNAYILKGDPAFGLYLLFDRLMERAYDEPDAMYGLLAERVYLPSDRSWVEFELRKEARFSDGTPVLAEDVVFSFETLKEKGSPVFSLPLKNITRAEAMTSARVRFYFADDVNRRDLPLQAASLPILSKKFYARRDFSEPSVEPPVGSGPYEIENADMGRSITYKLRDDYWASDLPVNRGRHNFKRISFEYYSDQNVAFEAFKVGELDLREEFVSRIWATQYDFPAIKKGLVLREAIMDGRPSGTQGYWINLRNPKFADVRVREALSRVFDFEWSNAKLFYGLYNRTDSFFEGSPMAAEGMPSAEEMALLNPLRDTLPESVFGQAYIPPVTDGNGFDRRQMRAAGKLLDEAGWKLVDGKRRNSSGDVLSIEFVDDSPAFERITTPYTKNLSMLGIEVSSRTLDPASYLRRIENFDFDITVARFSMSPTPGAELHGFFGSQSANALGSFNLSGIADKSVDSLIEAVIDAESRSEISVAVSALDRVLRAHHIWVPHWNKASHTIAWWDKYGRPKSKPPYNRAVLDTWWFDKEKAKALEARR